jgi:hypothetical protein
MMSNSSTSLEVPQALVEPILNLYRAGTSPQTISLSFNLSLEAVMSLITRHQSDPAHVRSSFQALELKSREFRCLITKKLMICPVVASDGKVYDQAALETWRLTSKLSPANGEPLSNDKLYPLPDLKARIIEFSRESLSQLEVCFKSDLETALLLDLAAECVSVLISVESLMSCLGSLSYLDSPMQKSLISALVPLVSRQDLAKLLMELVPISSFASSSTEVLRALLKNRSEEDDLAQEFSSLIELLSKPEPSSDLINLAFEASRYCSKAQLSQLQEVLKAVCPTDNHEFTELKLRSAELCVKERDLDTARTTIAGLNKDARLKPLLLDFYTRLGWNSEKKLFLVHSFEESLAQAAKEGLPLVQVEMLETLVELLKICNVAPDKLPFNTTGWVKNPDQSEHPRLLYYFPNSTSSMWWIDLTTYQLSPQPIPVGNCISPALCELPNGIVLITGGTLNSEEEGISSTEVTAFDPQTLTLTKRSPMYFGRSTHGCVCFEGQAYVIGGSSGYQPISDCEVYDYDSNSWQSLPRMSLKVSYINPVVVEATRTIYVIGGYDDEIGDYKDTIQEFSVVSKNWRVLSVRMDSAQYSVLCFKLNRSSTDVYFAMNSGLHRLITKEERLEVVKATTTIPSQSTSGSCYYSRGTLFVPTTGADLARVDIGPLN